MSDIEITVLVGEALERFASPGGRQRQVFEAALTKRLRAMLDDLDIPLLADIDVRSWDGVPHLAEQSYEVLVNGKRCRLPLRSGVEDDVEALALAASVYESIHGNRELIATPSAAIALRDSWPKPPDVLVSLTDADLSSYLAALIAHRVSVDRAKDFVPMPDDHVVAASAPEDLFEWTVSGPDKVAIKVHMGPDQDGLLADPDRRFGSTTGDSMSLPEMLDMMRDGLWYELGVMLPPVETELDEDLDENSFQFQLNDVRLPTEAGLADGDYLVNDTVDRLKLLGVTGRPAVNPANGSECAVITATDVGICERAGLTTWDSAGYLVLALSASIRRDAGVFLNADLVRRYLRSLGGAFPALVGAVEEQISILDLVRILRGLLEEQLGIRNLRGILEALLTARPSKEPDSDWIARGIDAVRLAQNRYICHKCTRDSGTLVVVLIDDEIETRLMQDRPFDDVEHRRLIGAIGKELGGLPPTAQTPVVLTKLGCRRRLRRLVEKELPAAAVLCYQDLAPDMSIQPIARVSWDDMS